MKFYEDRKEQKQAVIVVDPRRINVNFYCMIAVNSNYVITFS